MITFVRWPGNAVIRPALKVDGLARKPVEHWTWLDPSLRFGSRSHHKLAQDARPGAWQCSLCGRWVIRGVGKWWA